MTEQTVYKICASADWARAKASGALAPSADDARDGFIHLSAKDQVVGTFERHFKGKTELMLLAVDTALLPTGALRWEASRDGALFPHLYGDLPVAAVVSAEPIGG
jgi:uncharacterized protein (DUF952 family)